MRHTVVIYVINTGVLSEHLYFLHSDMCHQAFLYCVYTLIALLVVCTNGPNCVLAILKVYLT